MSDADDECFFEVLQPAVLPGALLVFDVGAIITITAIRPSGSMPLPQRPGTTAQHRCARTAASQKHHMGGCGGPGEGLAPKRTSSLGTAGTPTQPGQRRTGASPAKSGDPGQALWPSDWHPRSKPCHALRLSPIIRVGPTAALLCDATGPMRIARSEAQKTSHHAACARARQFRVKCLSAGTAEGISRLDGCQDRFRPLPLVSSDGFPGKDEGLNTAPPPRLKAC